MNPKKFLVILFIVLFSLIVGFLFWQNPEKIPHQVTDVIEKFVPDAPSQQTQENENEDIEQNMSANKETITTDELLQHSLDLKLECVQNPQGKVVPKLTKGVYSWIDANGIPNFSDVEPNIELSDLYDFKAEKVSDYFELSIDSALLPTDAKTLLSEKINQVFFLYASLIGSDNLTKVKLNVRLFSNQDDYNRYKLRKTPNENNAHVFYLSGINELVVYSKDFEKTTQIALHEASHVIGRLLIGNSAKWLAEGLSEYVENTDIQLKQGVIKANPKWFNRGRLTTDLVSLESLFKTTNKTWFENDTKRYAATSWAFIHFLMNSEVMERKLANILKEEGQNPCDVLPSTTLITLLGNNLTTLQQSLNSYVRQLEFKSHKVPKLQ